MDKESEKLYHFEVNKFVKESEYIDRLKPKSGNNTTKLGSEYHYERISDLKK